jgi:hypothetical protein
MNSFGEVLVSWNWWFIYVPGFEALLILRSVYLNIQSYCDSVWNIDMCFGGKLPSRGEMLSLCL